jgi:hypothetical protein
MEVLVWLALFEGSGGETRPAPPQSNWAVTLSMLTWQVC